MNFKINNRDWKIIKMSQDKIKQHIKYYKYDGEPQDGRYYGQTYCDEQIIYLDKDLNPQQKRQTLMHELGHCYIATFITHQLKKYSEEDVVNLISNSHDIIHNIVQKYFEEKKC